MIIDRNRADGLATAAGTRVLIIEARFYADLAEQMFEGARRVLDAAGAAWTRAWVPGSFELPAALSFALEAEGGGWDGVIALGCVIEGETDHYAHICREVSRALMDLAVDRGVPLGFGLLTCRTYAQALERARLDGQDKGGDAARACLRMIELKAALAGTATAAGVRAPGA
jgi:6,7-dimethyl-8-ribityllumazine synthase